MSHGAETSSGHHADSSAPALDSSGWAGHPAGLSALFFTEMWERFSYYGMRALLVLYMVAAAKEGGLGYSIEKSSDIYGWYTMLVYMSSIPGGLIADRFLGQRTSILIGGIIIAAGHFTLAFREEFCFYAGLGLIIFGTGLLKPNISTLLGKLYHKDDHRRDAGFSIFYMGINIGAFLSPLVCGTLAQSKDFKNWLTSMGWDPHSSWHWGFAAAGVGMILGLIHYVVQSKQLGDAGLKPSFSKTKNAADEAPTGPSSVDSAEPAASQAKATSAAPDSISQPNEPLITKDEWKKLGALMILFNFTILFWAIFEQGGSSLNIFADRLTDCKVFGWEFPSSWMQSLNAAFIVILAPIFSWLWVKLGDKEPSSPAKFALGVLFLGLGTGLMIPAAMLAAQGKVSPIWLTLVYLLQTAGELCLSPVGLSTVTKLAPKKFAAMTMGLWFLATSFGNKLAGFLAGKFDDKNIDGMINLYGGMVGSCVVAVLVLAVLTPQVRKLMGDVK